MRALDRPEIVDPKNLIQIAANLVLGKELEPLFDLCDRQETVKTSKLFQHLQQAHDRQKRLAAKIKDLHDQLTKKEQS